MSRAFSQRFTIARWKKPIFLVTCENKKNGVQTCHFLKPDGWMCVGRGGVQTCPNWTLWLMCLVLPFFFFFFKYVNRPANRNRRRHRLNVIKRQMPNDLSELRVRNRVRKARTSASKCGPTKTKFYTATKSYFYDRRGFFAVTKSFDSGEAAIPSARSRVMLIKFYRLYSVTVEKCPRAIFISFILFGFVENGEIVYDCIF